MLELHTEGNAVVSINITEQKVTEKDEAPAHIYKRSGNYTITGQGDYLIVKKKGHLISRVHMYREVLDVHILEKKGIASIYLIGDTWIEKITGRELKKERDLPDPIIATVTYGSLLLVMNRRRLLVMSHRLKVIGSTKLKIRYPEYLIIEENERLLALASSTERKAYIFTTTGISVSVIDTKGRIDACGFLVTDSAVYFCVALGTKIKIYLIQKRDTVENSPISQDSHSISQENSINVDQENIQPSKVSPAHNTVVDNQSDKPKKETAKESIEEATQENQLNTQLDNHPNTQMDTQLGNGIEKKENNRTVEVISKPEMEIETDHLEKITQILGNRKEARIYTLSKDGVICSWSPGESEAAAVYVEVDGARKLFWTDEE